MGKGFFAPRRRATRSWNNSLLRSTALTAPSPAGEGTNEGGFQAGAAKVQPAFQRNPFPGPSTAPSRSSRGGGRDTCPRQPGAVGSRRTPKLAAAAKVAPRRRRGGGGPAAATHPHQVADSGLHGRHGGGEVRDGLSVHLPLLVHDDQVGDLLGHRLQDALDGARVEDGHGGGGVGGAGARTQLKLPANSVPAGWRPTEKAAASARRGKGGRIENQTPTPSSPRSGAKCGTRRSGCRLRLAEAGLELAALLAPAGSAHPTLAPLLSQAAAFQAPQPAPAATPAPGRLAQWPSRGRRCQWRNAASINIPEPPSPSSPRLSRTTRLPNQAWLRGRWFPIVEITSDILVSI